MSRSMMLSVFAVAATAMTANAADLPARSRLGAIFAEPEEVRVEVYRADEYPAPIIGFNLLPDPPWARAAIIMALRGPTITPAVLRRALLHDGGRLPMSAGCTVIAFRAVKPSAPASHFLRKGIAQADGPVEHRPVRRESGSRTK